jgi:glyoxylase-like metal-dependent hydrolase (beta-lactamase superfamily II)
MNLVEIAEEYPTLTGELGDVILDPPDRTVDDEGAILEIGGRRIDLLWLGRGHTDNDIVIHVPDGDTVFAGDLLENGAPPWIGDGYPLDWPATIEGILAVVLAGTQAVMAVVPGHGDVGDRAFVERSLAEMASIALLARQVATGGLALADAARLAPYPLGVATEALERAGAQLRGELD